MRDAEPRPLPPWVDVASLRRIAVGGSKPPEKRGDARAIGDVDGRAFLGAQMPEREKEAAAVERTAGDCWAAHPPFRREVPADLSSFVVRANLVR